jgi:N-acetylglucosamine-6-phosphate deacetylase
VHNAATMMDCRLEDALAMASAVPARFLGLGQELGRIAPGCRADLISLGPNIAVREVWISGVAHPV